MIVPGSEQLMLWSQPAVPCSSLITRQLKMVELKVKTLECASLGAKPLTANAV